MQTLTELEIFEAEALPHLKDLYRTAVRLTRNQTEADDIVQEIYLQAWKMFDRYQAGTNCRAWLYKILFFKISHYRRGFKMQTRFMQTLDEDDSVLTNATFQEPIPQGLTDEEVVAAIDGLPLQYREVVLLADVEEFAYREIAEILDVPIGTVMSRLSRARKALRQSLSGVACEYGISKLQPSPVAALNAALATVSRSVRFA